MPRAGSGAPGARCDLATKQEFPCLGRFAADCGAFAKPACDLALRALEPDRAVKAHARLLSITSNKRLWRVAAGIIGDPKLADWLLERNGVPAAGPSRRRWVLFDDGLDLRRDDLDAARPPGAEAQEVMPAAAESDGEELTGESGARWTIPR